MMNKKRLAVLAMSAVMTASTVSMPVNAMDFSDGAGVQAAEAFSAGVDAQSVEVTEDTTEAVGLQIKTVAEKNDNGWNTADPSNPTLTLVVTYMDNSTREEVITTGFGKREQNATCTQEGGYYLTYAYPNTTFVFESAFVKTSDPTEHVYEEKINVTKPADCSTGTDGTGTKGEYCKVCGTLKPGTSEETITIKAEHTKVYGEVTYSAGTNTQLVSGNNKLVPVLVDKSKKGDYTKHTAWSCEKCDATGTEDKVVNVPAEITTAARITVTNLKNINDVTTYGGSTLGSITDESKLPKDEEIVLTDCTKDGSYDITYFNGDGEQIGTPITHTVKAHHVMAVDTSKIEYVDKNDAQYLKIANGGALDKDGHLTVINSLCSRDIQYYEISKCTACGKNEQKELRTAAKSANHTLDAATNTAKGKIEAYVGETPYATLLTDVGDNKYIKIVPKTATCDKAGTVDVELYCQICGEKAETLTDVKVGAMGHKEVTKKENVTEATCEAAGSYDLVTVCERCGKETQDKVHVTVNRLPHTNETPGTYDATTDKYDPITDKDKDSEVSMELVGRMVFGPYTEGQEIENNNGIGTTSPTNGDGTFRAHVFSNCGVCHKHEVELTKNVKYLITSVTKETTNKYGEVTKAGSITVKAVYTTDDKKEVSMEKTLPYFSSASVQLPDANKNGLLQDADGVFRYYESGVFQDDFTAMIDYYDGKQVRQFYVVNGLLASDFSGLMMYEDTWYYLNYGEVANYTGTVMYNDSWFYVSNGVLNTDVNGLVPYNGGTFLFIGGYLADKVNGLWMEPDTGDWYYLSLGRVLTEYTGVAMYDNAFFYIRNGKLARDYNGTVEFEGATFKVSAGQLYGQVK